MSLTEYILLAFSSLFVIVDPIAIVPAFIAMTPNDSPAAQLRMARLACLVAAGVLMLFALAGKWIFKVLGITLPAFQIAGSVLLLRIALDMLYATLILMSQVRGWEQQMALFGCIASVSLASYLIFRLAVHGARRLSPLALKLVTRLMGLLLAAVSVQFAVNGLAQTPLFSK